MNRRLGLACVGLLIGLGCNAIPPALPNQANITLDTIQQIQQDATLDATEKQQIVRAMLGLQDNAEDNRIVTFLLGLMVP